MTNSTTQPVFVPLLPGWRDALRQASHIAAAAQRPLRLVRAEAIRPGQVWHSSEPVTESALASILRRLSSQGIAAELVSLPGAPHEALIDAATPHPGALIFWPPQDDPSAPAFPREVRSILAQTACPVWLARPLPARRHPKVVACIALYAQGDPRAELSRAVLAQASSLARFLAGELHVLHVWEAFGESLLRSPVLAPMPQQQVEDYVVSTKKERAGALGSLLEECAIPPSEVHSHLGHGDVDVSAAAVCEREKASLAVFGWLPRTGLSGSLLKHTAEQAAALVTCPVVAVPPVREAATP